MNNNQANNEKKVLKAFRMEEGLVNEIKKVADEQNRTVSNMVNTVLKQHFNYGNRSTSIRT